jgi:hypothetical protein
LSYGNAPRGARSGGKGSSPKKSARKKKQEYHRHKQKVEQVEAPSSDEAKTKAIAALQKLGTQKLSNEPGGYDLQSWLKSLNVLLDDLQARVGADGLTREYYDKRDEVVKGILAAADTSEVDGTIASLNGEAAETASAIEGERSRIGGRLHEIDGEVDRLSKEMQDAQREQGEEKKGSFFGRLLGGDRRARREGEARLEEIRAKQNGLAAESSRLKSDLARLEDTTEESPSRRLVGIKSKIDEAQKEKERILQLGQERERVTNELIGLISPAPAAAQEGASAPEAAEPV